MNGASYLGTTHCDLCQSVQPRCIDFMPPDAEVETQICAACLERLARFAASEGRHLAPVADVLEFTDAEDEPPGIDFSVLPEEPAQRALALKGPLSPADQEDPNVE